MLILRWRRLRALRRAQRRHAYQGMSLGLAVICFVVVGTIAHGAQHPTVPLLSSGVLSCCALVAAYFLISWDRVPPGALLVFPAIWLSSLLVMSLQVGAFTSNFVGLTALAFLFGGITQPRWHTLWLLIPALPAWLVMVTGTGASTSLWLRLPIVLTLWVCASELVARHTHSINFEVTRLNRAVDIDELTGLANRRVLTAALAAAVPGDALILIDIDYFKNINDQYGHSTGDHVLRQFGRMIRRCIRLDDGAIRYGGEELLVVLRHPGTVGARRFDSQLRTEIQQITPTVSYSAGCAIINTAESAHQALERADTQLYEAKRSGRNRTVGDHTMP